MTTWAIVVAAGAGSRFGALKQYEALGDRRVLDWAVGAARTVATGVVLAVPLERAGHAEEGVSAVVAGGATRSGSVRAALAAVPADADIIVVHDAVRPFAPAWLFRAVVAAVEEGADGAVPALPVSDTVKLVREGVVVDTLRRSEVVAVQTPQGFRAEVLRRAHAAGAEATDDAALAEAVGGRVVAVAGDPLNAKLTRPEDLDRARERVALRPGGPGRAAALRTGIGFDVHPFSDESGRPLVLGGVEVVGGPGLAGHSDADVVAHAVADALLGAAALGDLGTHFPATDPEWKGCDSLMLLDRVVGIVAAAGWTPASVDCSIVAERPSIGRQLPAMQERLTAVVGAQVSVKAKRAEGLGALGRGEGVSCWAVALLERLDP